MLGFKEEIFIQNYFKHIFVHFKVTKKQFN